MGKHWVREQIRQDEVQKFIFPGLRWLRENSNKAGMLAGGAAVVVIILILAILGHQSRKNAAWDRLSVAQSTAYAGDPDGALSQIAGIVSDYPGTLAAGYAALFAGDVQFQRGKHQEAAAHYEDILKQGSPAALQALAQANIALSLEAGQQCNQAVASAEAFLQNYPDHYLAPQIHACLARCQDSMGLSAQAKASRQKIQLQYPDTSWSNWAREKLSSEK